MQHTFSMTGMAACAFLLCNAAYSAALPDTTTTLPAAADSYVESVSVWNNYGKITYMRVNTGRDGLLRFDLSDLADKEVIKAELHATPVAAFPVPLSVSSLLDNGWKEYGVNYNNRPSTVVAALGNMDGSTGAEMLLDVTSAVRTFQGQPMTLKLSSTNTDKLGYLNTRESAKPPVLVITSRPRTVTLAPSADSYVDPAAPTGNFASVSPLQIDGQPTSRAFLKFDLSALTAKNVLAATLRIKPIQQHGGTVYVRVLQNTDTNVNVLTFNSQPALVPDHVALQTTVGADGWQEFDLTALVKATGLMPLALALDGDSGQTLSFPSIEGGADAPQLVVAYSKAAIAPPPQVAPPPLKVGINIETPSYYGTEVPLVDLMKQGHEWYTGCQSWRDSYCSAGQFRPGGGSFDTKEQDLLNMDENGWVKTLPAPADGITTHVNYTTVATLIPSSLSPQWPSGRLTVLYDGEGTLYYSFSNGTLVKNNALSSPGRDVLDISLTAGKPAGTAIQLMITATDPKKTGNYLRNIRVLPPGGVCSDDATQYCRNDMAGASCKPTATCEDFEQVYQTKPFDPRFLANIKRFDTLRFMGYQNTNDANLEVEWRDRTKPDNYTWQRANYHHNPAENLVAMGNTLHRNVWINIPLKASDDYVTQLASLVHSQLTPDLKVYVEYGNEIWNTAFAGGNWVEAQGVARWPFAASTAYEKRLQWQGVRTAQVCDIWKSVWGSDAGRLSCVAGVQPGNSWSASLVLDCPLYVNETGAAPCFSRMNAIAVAPYFGGMIGQSNHTTDLGKWVLDADGGLNRLFTEIFSGGQFTDSPAGGAIASAQRALDLSVTTARDRGLQTVNYEGGQHLVGIGPMVNNPAIVNLFSNANRDSRMGTAYTQYLTMLKGSGVSLFNQWTSVGTYSTFGNWGLLEARDQAHSPKYDAMTNFLGTIGQ
ncbi:MAG: hypothetical protein RLY71_1908 [Pseudomonadota bacterium]